MAVLLVHGGRESASDVAMEVTAGKNYEGVLESEDMLKNNVAEALHVPLGRSLDAVMSGPGRRGAPRRPGGYV